VKYWTWAKEDKVQAMDVSPHPTLKVPHMKFSNFRFDVDEFTRLVKQMVEYVRRHPAFVERRRRRRRALLNEEL